MSVRKSKKFVFTNNLPPDVEEGIRDTFGRKAVVTMRKMVKLLDPVKNTFDMKVLILTPYRFQVLSIRAPFKVEVNFHFLNISCMESQNPDSIIVSVKSSKTYALRMIGSDDADQIIGRVALSLRMIFPGIPLSRIMRASLEPVSRQKFIQQMLTQADQSEPGPCGNFSEQYRCICDYLRCTVREEVEWDVDTIYLSQSLKEINLKDFDLPDGRDVAPIIAVMVYNKWFESLIISNQRLPGDLPDLICKVVRNSKNLKELVLDNVGLKSDFMQRLASNLMENKDCALEKLNLSNNPVDDKGIIFLSGPLPCLTRSNIQQLRLSRTGLSSKGVNGLCQALRSNINIVQTLTHLDLSHNSLKCDDAEGLYSFLSNDNCLEELDLSATNGAVEVYVSALARGCCKHMKRVLLSKNHFFIKQSAGSRYPHFLEEDFIGNRKQKENVLPVSFQQFFQETRALQLMDLSECKVPAEALKVMLEGLQENKCENLTVELCLASCELKAGGCKVIQSHVASLTNLTSLDLTDNGFDAEMLGLLRWCQRNRSLRELKLGRNLSGVKPKHMRQIIESVVELVQEDDSLLETLSLSDSKIREFTHVLLGCLGSNTSLTTLDISGNLIGDSGARVLAKSLQINSKLRTLKIDRNSLTAAGFNEIANSLERNYTLRYLPYPVHDVVAAIKQHPERTQTSLAKIQDLLLRNANTNRATNEQQFRLHKAVTNTAQIVLDKLAEKVDDTIGSLEMLGTQCESDVERAKHLVKDARNSKELLSDIYGLGMERSAGESSQLKFRIEGMAKKMDQMVGEHIEKTVQSMSQSAESQCPHVYETAKEKMEKLLKEKCKLPVDCIMDHVIKSSGTEIVNKVSELNLAIATLISDKLTDTLLDELSHCNITLTEQLNKSKRDNQSSKADTSRDAADDVIDPTYDFIAGDNGVKSDDVLPDMRKERAQSVAKRRRRPEKAKDDEEDRKSQMIDPEDAGKTTDFDVFDPYSNDKVKEWKKSKRENKLKDPPVVGDVDYPPVAKDLPATAEDTSVEEIVPASVKDEVSEDIAVEEANESEERVAEADVGDKMEVEEQTEEGGGVEAVPIEPEEPGKTKAEEEAQGESGETDNDEEKKDENNKHEVVEEDATASKDDEFDELGDLAPSSSALEHVTKFRPRGPMKSTKRRTRRVKPEKEQLDDFFDKDVSTTDFTATPTPEEVEELARQERLAEKKSLRRPGMGLPIGGMPMGGAPGMPMLNPAMLRKKQPASPISEESNPNDDKVCASPTSPHPPTTAPRRPKGGMVGGAGMPSGGMGNILAEMKKKKLSKKVGSPDDQEAAAVTSSSPPTSPIGPGMLKKRSENSNTNNNAMPASSPTSIFGPRSILKKPGDKPEAPTKKPEAPAKKPILPPSTIAQGRSSLKPVLHKKPPPLPTKPKPSFVRPENNEENSTETEHKVKWSSSLNRHQDKK